MKNNMNLEDLTKPIPYKWKVQTGKRGDKGGWCVAYIDARDAMDLLDGACGIGGWKDEYLMVGDKLTCKLSLRINEEWIAKQDTGTESSNEAEKGQFSDAFKRAGVKWGIGRFLYNLEMKWIDFDGNGKPVDKSGKRIYDLTKYFEENNHSSEPQFQIDIPEDPFADKLTYKHTCPVCGTNHNGQYPKCYQCYLKDKK
jgi:hypothetical protein